MFRSLASGYPIRQKGRRWSRRACRIQRTLIYNTQGVQRTLGRWKPRGLTGQPIAKFSPWDALLIQRIQKPPLSLPTAMPKGLFSCHSENRTQANKETANQVPSLNTALFLLLIFFLTRASLANTIVERRWISVWPKPIFSELGQPPSPAPFLPISIRVVQPMKSVPIRMQGRAISAGPSFTPMFLTVPTWCNRTPTFGQIYRLSSVHGGLRPMGPF